MNTARKNKLFEYLYPSVKAIEFMQGDFYVELLQVLPKKVCFSIDNQNKKVRDKNFALAQYTVKEFLDKNHLYQKRLKELFLCKDHNALINDIIVGYVLFLTPHINKWTGADVFSDTRSVCYSKTSILDLL